MDYKETHISFLYDDLVKEYGNEQGKQLYALMCKKFAYLCEKEMKSENNEINEHVFQRMLPTISMYLTLILQQDHQRCRTARMGLFRY